MGHLVCPKGGAKGITWSTDRGDERKEEERPSKIREYNLNVGEMKERDKLRTRKRDRVLRTEVGWGLKKKQVTREKTEN